MNYLVGAISPSRPFFSHALSYQGRVNLPMIRITFNCKVPTAREHRRNEVKAAFDCSFVAKGKSRGGGGIRLERRMILRNENSLIDGSRAN
jgi:hypothetical protein